VRSARGCFKQSLNALVTATHVFVDLGQMLSRQTTILNVHGILLFVGANQWTKTTHVEFKELEIQRALGWAFKNAGLPFCSCPSRDFDAIACPIARAFVHQTKWTKRLGQFRVNHSSWLNRVKTETPGTFSRIDICSITCRWGDHENDFPFQHEFWRGHHDDFQHPCL
jgi:hypothetical protein